MNSRFIHAAGIYLFTKGFLLTRLVLDEKSSCSSPPITLTSQFPKAGTPEGGCWHPKTFDKAVVIIIDALRYDFTIPFENTTALNPAQAYHNAIPLLYDTAINKPHNAFLLPFIADPPTTTLQRLKGLTTGTLPTFIDAGSNFAGTAIEEDNLLMQLKDAGRRIVHLGDDTWTALFPGYFEADISRAYDSFNVHDLHTVDNGVIEHIFPLLSKDKSSKWDVMFAHFLGVDHAGHRYGPNHFAMTAKLQQMDDVLRKVVAALDDDTLLVVMGDHGMDPKGDHGGESDDEVEAALWMYSKKGIFGRTDLAYVTPPQTAKIRPVDQIDLAPTLALLLGLPIPFNNIGKPIEEAFAGKKGNSWENMAGAVRMAAAGTQRYQQHYYVARGINESTINTSEGTPHALWAKADQSLAGNGKEQMWKDVYGTFSDFQVETLRIFRDLWARFDVPSMILGIAILAAGVLSLVLWANVHADDGFEVEDPELEKAERQLELDQLNQGVVPVDEEETAGPQALKSALIGSVFGAILGTAAITVLAMQFGCEGTVLDFALAGGSAGGLLAILYTQISAVSTSTIEETGPQSAIEKSSEARSTLKTTSSLIKGLFPTSIWGWMAVIFTVSQSAGFASNSFTIWEDSQLLFFISTFGVATALCSMRIENYADRTLGIYHSVLFVALGWFASFSKLCREEQIPYCRSTYYASATSSTSAPWQLVIPFILAVGLPSIIKSYYLGSRSYEGFAPVWIGWVFRFGLILSAVFWTLDAADDGEWFTYFSDGELKTIRVPFAQLVFAIAIGAGSTAFGYAPPCVSISTIAAPTPNSQMVNSQGTTVTILGYANTHGSRYFLLVVNILLAILMVQKPMGGGAIALMSWQTLSLLEILDLNSLTSSPIGPIVLALLGSFHFFKTGHQATLSSIQWESAFIPLHNIRYPWSPILIALNSFGAQILAATAVPLVVLWKQQPKKKGILRSVAAALAWHLAYYAVIGLATTMWAGHLRRHLMLYRIFNPKFMTAALVLIVVDIIGIFVALMGVRWNTLSVAEVFGWG
jgi:phosphatidylinositol glycan class O